MSAFLASGCLDFTSSGGTPTDESTPSGSASSGKSASTEGSPSGADETPEGPVSRNWEATFQTELGNTLFVHDGAIGVLESTDGPTILTKVSAEDGSEVGRFRLPTAVQRETITLQDGRLIGCGNDAIFAVDWEDGNLLWKEEFQGYPLAMTLDTNSIYVGARTWTGDSRHGALLALASEDGSQQWRIETEVNVNTPPLVTGDRVFVTTSNRSEEGGTLLAFDRATQGRLWGRTTAAKFDAPPVVVDGTLYGGTGGNYNDDAPPSELFALNPNDGGEDWVRTDDGQFAVNSRPAVVGEDLVFSSDLGVERVSRTDGSTVWRHETNQWISTNPVVRSDTLYFGTGNGDVGAIELANGEQRWKTRTSGRVSSLTVVDDAIYWVRGTALISATIAGSG